MPIKAQDRAGKTLTRLGIIRLGTKKVAQSGKEYPSEAEYFVLVDAPELVPSYGERPTEILIYLPFPTVDENLIVFHEAWKAWGCLCRGDGDKIITLRTEDGATKLVVDGHTPQGEILPCPGEDYVAGQNGYPRCADCKPSMMLRVLVRDKNQPDRAIGGFGFYQVRSHSMANILSLTGQLRYVEEMAHNMGATLQGIPMKLKRVQRETSYVDPKDGQRKKTMKWFIDLEFDIEWVERAQSRVKQLAMGESPAMLPSGGLQAGSGDLVIDNLGARLVPHGSVVDGDYYVNDAIRASGMAELEPENEGVLFDLQAMKDNIPGGWKDFHATMEQVWGEGYSGVEFMKLLGEVNGKTKQTLDAETWVAAVDLLIERVKGQV